MLLSIVSFVGIQLYFLSNTFQSKRQDLFNQMNASFRLVIYNVEEDRESRKRKLHLRDLKDTSIVRIEYEFNEGVNPSVVLVDAKTDDRLITYTLMRTFSQDSLTEEILFEKAFGNINGENSTINGYISISDLIDNRYRTYEDTLSLNRELLDSLMVSTLKGIDIDVDFEVLYLPEDSTYDSEEVPFISEYFELEDRNEKKNVAVVIPSTFSYILKSSSFVMMASFSALILLLASFWFLLRTIVSQKRLANMKDDFIDNVTHELLTPLSTLKISLESLEKHRMSSESANRIDYLSIAQAESKRIADIVQNVLQVSLHNPGQMVLRHEDVELRSFLEEVIHYYELNEHVTDRLVFDLDEVLYARGDRQHLKNVMHNLIDNAIKYSEDRPLNIEIKVQEKEDIYMSIRDNGPGIPAIDQPRIFDKFHRVSQNGLHEVKGMGIGLYYAKMVCQKMGGKLILEQSDSSGSCFTVILKRGEGGVHA